MIKLLDSRFTLEVSKFSDGTRKIVVVSPAQDMEAALSSIGLLGIEWLFEDDSEVLTLIFVVNWLRDRVPGIHLYLDMPYVPYARMDRVEKVGDVFTLKYFAGIINSLQFDYVQVKDPHSRVTPALIDRVKVCDGYTKELITGFLEDCLKKSENLSVVFPDRGSYERYTSLLGSVFERHKIQAIYGEKTRDWTTSQISSFSLNIRGKKMLLGNVVIIDDIITSGGTIRKCVEALDKMEVGEIKIYSTFLEETALTSEPFRWVVDSGCRVFSNVFLFDVEKVGKELMKGISKISI